MLRMIVFEMTVEHSIPQYDMFSESDYEILFLTLNVPLKLNYSQRIKTARR